MRGRRFAASAALAATGLAAPLVTAWLFWRDGGWDTYRAPLFLPFLFAAGLMVRFSLSPMTADPRPWRSFVARAAAGAAAVAGGAGLLASRNPITGLHARDIVGLAALAGVLSAPINQVRPLMGADLIIVVFAVVVIGGMGSIMGSIITGFALGVIEGLTKYFYPEASNTVVFVLMVLVLLVKPAGLTGRAA